MALADVPLSLSPSSPHRAAHHVRLPTTPPPPLPPPSCAVAKEATTAAHLRSSTTADPPRPPRPTAGPPPPRGDQELRLAESYAILEPRLLGSRGSTESLPSPPTRASPIFPDPFKRIRVPRRCSGAPLAAAGGPLLATSPLSIACYAAWASWSTARRRWTAGGRRHPSTAHALALAHRRPCPIPPSATIFPTPSSDLRRPLPSSSSSASTSSLLPPSSLNQGSPHLIRSRPRRASPTIGTRRWFGPGGGSCNPGVAAAVVPFRRHQGSTQRPRAASRAGQSANDAAALAMRRRLPWRTRRQQPWAWKTVLDPVSRRRCLVVKQRGPSAAPCPTSRPRGVSVALLDPASPCNRLCRQHLHEIVLVSVVQDQRQESAKYDDENKANDGEPSSIEAEQSIGILSFNAHPKFQLPEIKASFSRCRSKLPHEFSAT
ncbi:dapper homolog 3 isoform X2 [Triticum aestivum]|uniref:dapper homolog 3 isoform X2 n=1 Tax=Triticum aestivum TaxID=4565 RepID=UPI001D00849C|nr:dapper homolog 3-like isoform X2 [Triticum aestivum]